MASIPIVPTVLSAVVFGLVLSTRSRQTVTTPEKKSEETPPGTTPPKTDTPKPDVTTTPPLRPVPRPGSILIAPPPPKRPPRDGDACTRQSGCYLYPKYAIDPTQPMRVLVTEENAGSFRIPYRGRVDLLEGPVRVEVRPGGPNEPGVTYYIPSPLGQLTLYRIRFCLPGTLTCYEGWIEENDLGPP